MIGGTYSIVGMSIWCWARAIPFVFGPEPWERHLNVRRLVDEISARPAAEKATALASRYVFELEMEAARKAMFPQNARLQTA